MEQDIKIKMFLFCPLVFEKQYDIYKKFHEMIMDITQTKLAIEIDGKSHEIEANFIKERIKYFRYYKTLVLKFRVNIDDLFKDEKIYNNTNQELELSEEKRKEFIKSTVITEIKKYVMDFTFAINLAYPGLFEFNETKIFVNNKEDKSSKIDMMLIDWLDVYINFLNNKWPVIHSIKFEQVWEWLNHRTNFMSGISKTAIDRALNALTYTMGDASYEEIFYVLMGIEALYNDNDSNGIAEQIRAKTESLLKRPKIFKKRISKFYDNRSKFIHGKLNFPNKYCPYDATKEFEEFFSNKYISTVNDARSILISTIQEYIIQDANRMETNIMVTLGN